ncbi:hypothetical protein AFLA_009774 [Aspergillus flavus NRRL3357]|nr:hypothetical protein AFLA_009774 [Aspergillus flavus NRRL3357]
MALPAPRFNRLTDSLPTFLVNDGPAVALPASGSGISGGASSSRKRQSAGQYYLLLPYYFTPTSASDSAYLHSVSRWSFYIRLPIAGTAIVFIVLLLTVKSKSQSIMRFGILAE